MHINKHFIVVRADFWVELEQLIAQGCLNRLAPHD